EAAELADVLPVLQNLGLRVVEERPYHVTPSDIDQAWIYDFGLDYQGEGELEVDAVRERFHEAFARVWHGELEDDGLNALVLRTPLTWRDITVLRAIARYLRQAGTRFSNAYMEQALNKHAQIARALVELFALRFDPATARDDEAAEEIASA